MPTAFRCLALYIVLIPAFLFLAHHSATAQNTASWEVWRQENLTKLSDHTTDSVRVVFDTTGPNVNMTLICEARQPFGPRSTRRLALRVLNFTGTGSYDPVVGDAATYWENFTRDSTCGCVSATVNKVVFNQWDTAQKVLAGTFEFRCRSFIAATNDAIDYRIRNGSFRWGGTDKIVIETDPADTVLVPQITASDTTINITVRASERNADLEGVTIKVLDPTRSGSPVYQPAGTTDASGRLTYTVTLQRDAAAGDYEVKFYGTKTDHDSSDTTSLLIRYRNRIWEWKCAGATVLTFDAGEGKEWKPVSEGSPLITATGDIRVNGVISLNGKVRINTTAGAEKVFVDSGDVSLLTRSDEGNPEELLLTDVLLGPDNSMSLPDCTGLFNVVRDSIVKTLSKKLFSSISISIEKFSIINRPNAKGIDIEGKITLGALARLGCDPVQDPTGNLDAEEARRAITVGLAITTEGFDNLRIKAENLAATDAFCLKEISASLDNFNKTAGFGAKVTISIKGTEFTGTFDSFWKSGTGNLRPSELNLDSLRAELTLESCKPIGQTMFCFKTAKFSTSGWANDRPEGIKVRAGVVMNSNEQIVLERVPLLHRLLDSAQIAQVEGTLEYTYPATLTGVVAVRVLRITRPFRTKPWQQEYTGSVSLDLNNGLTMGLSGNLYHLGEDDYFLSGQANMNIYWTPMIGMTTSYTGSVRIPQPGSDILEVPGVGTVLRFMKLSGWIPQTLGQGSMSIALNPDLGLRLRGSIDVSQNPITYIRSMGIMSLTVKYDDNGWDVHPESGTTPPGPYIRKTFDNVQAQETDTIMVDGTMSRVFIMIVGKTTAPSSTLVAPDGTEFTTTAPDSSVIRFATPGNEMVNWTLIDPKAGDWVLKLASPDPADVVEVTVQRRARPFTVSASQVNDQVEVTWDVAGSTDQGEVTVYLDQDGTGLNGIYLGNSMESLGRYTFTLSDSLTECEYRVYATRFVPGETMVSSYAPQTIETKGSSVARPLNVHALSDRFGYTTVTWTVPPGSALSGFHVFAIDRTSGATELVAAALTDERRVSFTLADHSNKRIVVRGYDEVGSQSCPTTPVEITTTVHEPQQDFTSSIGSIRLIPNPARTEVTVQYMIDGTSPHFVTIHDVTGRTLSVVSLQPEGGVGAGSERTGDVTIPCAGFSTGVYIVRVVTDKGDVSGLLMVTR
jgi:hypothetical protein